MTTISHPEAKTMKTPSVAQHAPTPIDIVISCSATGNLTSGGLIRYFTSDHVDQKAKEELGAFIVKCVNSHEELLSQLKEARAAVQAFKGMVSVIQKYKTLPIPSILETAEHNTPIIIANCDEAIAKAEGKQP